MTAIRVNKGGKNEKKRVGYKSSRSIITPKEALDADKLDKTLEKTIKSIETILLDKKLVLGGKKQDPLGVWYLIGKNINYFLGKNNVKSGDENIFWEHLYDKSSIINKSKPKNKVNISRNDFKTASIMAEFDIAFLQSVGTWALWRELLSYKSFLHDRRVLTWVINCLIKNPGTRDEARPLMKAVAARLKKLDTIVLNDQELQEKLEETQEC